MVVSERQNVLRIGVPIKKCIFLRNIITITVDLLCDELMYSYDLENMSVLNLPNSLEKIEDEVFEGLFCEAVIVPKCCTSIGNYAFRNCRKLKYVRIPANRNSAKCF